MADRFGGAIGVQQQPARSTAIVGTFSGELYAFNTEGILYALR